MLCLEFPGPTEYERANEKEDKHSMDTILTIDTTSELTCCGSDDIYETVKVSSKKGEAIPELTINTFRS